MQSKSNSFQEVDKYRLDEELVSQPKLYEDYALKLADAKFGYAEAKDELAVRKAEFAQSIRANPVEWGLRDKPTEGSIDEVVTIADEIRELTRAMNKARHRVDVLDATVKALEHRKGTIEGLIKLHGQSYFATPKAKGVDGQAMEELSKTATTRTIKIKGRAGT